jgi:hypothetical protein
MFVYITNFVTCRRTGLSLSAVQCKNCFIYTSSKACYVLFAKKTFVPLRAKVSRYHLSSHDSHESCLHKLFKLSVLSLASGMGLDIPHPYLLRGHLHGFLCHRLSPVPALFRQILQLLFSSSQFSIWLFLLYFTLTIFQALLSFDLVVDIPF